MYIFAVALQDGEWHQRGAMPLNVPADPTRCGFGGNPDGGRPRVEPPL